ncbi:MAG TPA: hypothetical protein VNZ57_13605, partial [Longimicrobiales bacterium]|nr:hypothetical protein [Longimicrobiales bacterium]
MPRSTKFSLLAVAVALVLIAVVLRRPAGETTDQPAMASEPTTMSQPAPGKPDLAAVRAAVERFRDVNVALAEGYVRDPMDVCDTAEQMGRPAALGAMGIHYFRPDLLGITGPPDPRVTGTGTHTDFLMPAVLLYEPQADGSVEL